MKPLCPVCERVEVTDAALAGIVREYVEGLNAELRVDDAQYAARLACCEACTELVNGMCRLCGCFVLARAAKRTSGCPAVRAKW